MELLEAIKTRRSVREFTGPRIPDEHIGMILDVGRYAPSPENRARARFLDLELEDIEHESFKLLKRFRRRL